MEPHSQNDYWYKLDNAAKVFPAVISKRITTVFRLAAVLKDNVNPQKVQLAMNHLLPRFPYYRVHMKSGLFWPYLDKNTALFKVKKEKQDPCVYMPIKKGGYLFRVLYYKKRISVEFSHILTDGFGAVTFLKSLLMEYFFQVGMKLSGIKDIIRPDSPYDKQEAEDAFQRYFKKKIPSPEFISKAFHIKSSFEPVSRYNIITGILPEKDVLKKAHEYEVSVTTLLGAVYISSLQDYMYEKKAKPAPIRLMVPVNLRKLFPSKTMRNFSLYVLPGVDARLGKFSFDEILQQFHHYIKININEKYLSKQISRNVKGEHHVLARLIPLFIKKPIGQLIYYRLGENLYSGTLTNLGHIDLPDSFQNYVNRLEFLPTPERTTGTNCAVISYNNKLCISFGRVIKETDIEQLFFTKLVKMGISVKIESN